MISHSVRYGADHFNFDEQLQILGLQGSSDESLRKLLSDILNIPDADAAVRVHNILELAAELSLISNRQFVNTFLRAISNKGMIDMLAGITAKVFDKDAEKSKTAAKNLFRKAKPEYFDSAYGLARFWGELSAHFDPQPDYARLANLIEKLSDTYQGNDEIFFSKAVEWTSKNISKVRKNVIK